MILSLKRIISNSKTEKRGILPVVSGKINYFNSILVLLKLLSLKESIADEIKIRMFKEYKWISAVYTYYITTVLGQPRRDERRCLQKLESRAKDE